MIGLCCNAETLAAVPYKRICLDMMWKECAPKGDLIITPIGNG